MAEFFAELKRRQMFRVGAAYAVLAWLLLQIVNNVAPVLDLPLWVARAFLLLLVIGFPVALFFAWLVESKTQEGPRSKSSTVDWALFGAVAIVILLIGYQQIAPRQADIDAAQSASASPAGISIAVLPFANMSGDASQEFFSDGITQEITSALAKVRDLRVVARTSAFEFKGQNRNIRTLGEQLGATHLIEGSVRKVGDRVRITVQLITAADGTNVWSEDYDRQLTDIFAVQEDIARTITASLNMPLGLKPGENLVTNRNIDPDSHEKLLRAKALYDGRTGTVFDHARAESLLNEVLAKVPDYALAWVVLSAVYYEHANNELVGGAAVAETLAEVNELRAKGEAAARRAIEADPNLASAYAMSAVYSWSRARTLEAEELFAKALALDPNDAYVLDEYANRLSVAGRVKDSLATRERARAIEPFNPGISARMAVELWIGGQNDAAIALAKTLRSADRASVLARVYASLGRHGEAADALMEIAGDPNSVLGEAARLLRTASVQTASPEGLPRLPRGLNALYLSLGAPARTLDTYGQMAEANYFFGNNVSFLWHPAYAPARKTERFTTLMRESGLVDYWRVKGWPEFCRPTTGDDFVCD
jgi:TolB-like protein/tetratricopeptide (TPR) repeat protein